MGNFGPNSNNPRMRRAFAHAQLQNFRKGKVSFEEVRLAVDAASHTRKGHDSHFEATLVKIATGATSAVLFIDWTGGFVERPALGGYVMSRKEATIWEQRHHDAVAKGAHAAYNQIHHSGYPSVTLTAPGDQKGNFTWGKAYSLSVNPARARLEEVNYKRP